jgi:hypothetical protein
MVNNDSSLNLNHQCWCKNAESFRNKRSGGGRKLTRNTSALPLPIKIPLLARLKSQNPSTFYADFFLNVGFKLVLQSSNLFKSRNFIYYRSLVNVIINYRR